MKPSAFVWKAVNSQGQVKRGITEGSNMGTVRANLREQGYWPILIRPHRNFWRFLWHWRESGEQWISFTRRLATILEAGIPLLQALEILNVQGMDKHKKLQWQLLKEGVEAGSDLSEALLVVTPAPSLYIQSMIRAGEQTGTLVKSLKEVADELEQERYFRRKIKGAMTYPLLVSGAALIVFYVLGLWILPMYEKLFAGLGAELPFLTRVVFAWGRQLPSVLWGILGVVTIAMTFLVIRYPQTWRRELQKVFSHVPIIGTIWRLSDLVQFNRILGRLLRAGIPLLESLKLTAGTVRTKEMQTLLANLSRNVYQGKRLAPVLRLSKVFPADAGEMLAIAEDSGQLDNMLMHLAQMFRRELEERLEKLAQMVGPALIIGLAGVIGVVAVSVLLPIFDVGTHLQ